MENVSRRTGLVYHYTTAEGLKSIIENRCLWATAANFLNDISEFQHGGDVVAQVLGSFGDYLQSVLPEDVQSCVDRSRAEQLTLGALKEHWNATSDMTTFVTSFFKGPQTDSSKDMADPGDSLEQWRAYSGTSTGYCIGFDAEGLAICIPRLSGAAMGRATFFRDCIYDEAQKRQATESAIRKAIDETLPDLVSLLQQLRLELKHPETSPGSCGVCTPQSPEWKDKPNSLSDTSTSVIGQLNNRFMSCFGELMMLSASMKHAAFAAEREWRGISFDSTRTDVKFRSGRLGLVPFIEHKFAKDDEPHVLQSLIRRIVVGPLGFASDLQRRNAVAAVRMLLQRNGLTAGDPPGPNDVVIESSRIPYRGY